jgi:spore photoproduct lyase
MPRVPLREILIGEGADGHPFTSKLLKSLSGIPVRHEEASRPRGKPDRILFEKETLELLAYKGGFLKPCPGTREYICCGYQILNVGTNCPLNCSYCILQSYFNQPYLRTFVNLEEKLEGVLKAIDGEPDRVFRIGTGEFTDSLALDPIVGWSELLIPQFSRRENAVLELKTKTDRIDRVLRSKHRNRIILSWSLNSPFVSAHEEHGAPSIKRRLEAARRCQSEGFALSFHFDPLLTHQNWREEYLKTIELLDSHVDPKGVIWISMGSFRFMPPLKTIIRKRHPETMVLDGEFILGLDGKMRYFKPIRIELYSFVRRQLEKWHPDLGLYLCMESDEVWEDSMGWSPRDSLGLATFLDQRVVNFFG